MPKEAVRYLENAKELLSKASIEDDIYTDIKYVVDVSVVKEVFKAAKTFIEKIASYS